MKKLVGLVLFLYPALALAISPYFYGDKVAGGDVKSVMAQVEKKLTAAGFTVVGEHRPQGLPLYGSIVATDKGLLEAIHGIGGAAIVGAGIRIGVKADGTVSYINPDYWYRAYFRKDFPKAAAAVKAVQEKLAKALGSGKAFGGDVAAEDLPGYHYMPGMETFDSDKNELKTYASFDEALQTIRGNLAKGVKHTSKVYEVVMPDKKLAVFGVAMDDPDYGESWWVAKIGPDHIAALPWEIYVIDNKAYALFGRYRTALSWPALGMWKFMTIGSHPDTTLEMLTAVAGGKPGFKRGEGGG